MTPATGKVLTTAMIAASCVGLGSLVAEKLPVTDAPRGHDLGGHNSGHPNLLQNLLDSTENLAAEAVEQFRALEVKRELLSRFDELDSFHSRQVRDNLYLLPVRKVMNSRLKRFENECKGMHDALVQAWSPSEIKCIASFLGPALELNEKRARSQGFLNVATTPFKREQISKGSYRIQETATSGYLVSERIYKSTKNRCRVEKSINYNPDGSILFTAELDGLTMMYRDSERNPIARIVHSKDGSIKSREMYGLDGKAFSTYAEEKRKNPELTAEAYMEILAKNLNTWGKLDFYIRLMIDYKKPGHINIQSLEETLEKGEGNCLAYAFFASDLLTRQGHKTFVVSMGELHAACYVLIEKDGKYFAVCVDNWGVDINGNRYGHEVDFDKLEGFESPQAAMNGTFEKYTTRRFADLEDGKFEVEDAVVIINAIKDAKDETSNKTRTEVQLLSLVSSNNPPILY